MLTATRYHPTRCLRVLLVEDHADTAQSTAELLQLYGFEVVVATDGLEALDALRSQNLDVVLLDIGLPRMSGYEVARQMHNWGGARRPLVVAVSGYSADDRRDLCAESGIDLFLSKPVNTEVLLTLLERFQRILIG